MPRRDRQRHDNLTGSAAANLTAHTQKIFLLALRVPHNPEQPRAALLLLVILYQKEYKMNSTDIENEVKASVAGDALVQYTVYLTKDQAYFIHQQAKKRREMGFRASFSDVVRELILAGHQAVIQTTETLQSMKGANL